MKMNYQVPLRTPKNREYNLYLANYCSHHAKMKLKTLMMSPEIPKKILQQLKKIMSEFKVLEDIEHD